jgi:predicted ABC-class ATPase
MQSSEDLRRLLSRIDGRGYKAYRDIRGTYGFEGYTLFVDYVQGDPFASPSRIRVRIPLSRAGFPAYTFSSPIRRYAAQKNPALQSSTREIALRDFVTRAFDESCQRSSDRRTSRRNRGTGKSGLIDIDHPGQEILERSSIVMTDDSVEARFVMGLPAFGRRIAARHAQEMFFEELPRIVERSLLFSSLPREVLYRHIETYEDADVLRGELDAMGLVAFVADGSILPRASGIDPRPLSRGKVVPFLSPPSLRREVELPNRGRITGMGIPKGVTLIVGGGYHGKSTLLRALELGVYNHIPGDGREYVVTTERAVKIRSEDGRRIEKVDISPFISNLPFEQDTVGFSTEDASGSTSQAANIMEALEASASVLLIDEDTSATNFMIRDHRMQELVAKEREPITPFIDKVGQLYSDLGVSTILVMGGSGDYFDAANFVVCMVEYSPQEVTQRARRIAEKFKAERKPEGGERFGDITPRIPLSGSFDPSKGRKEVKISPKGLHSIAFGRHSINLACIEQLVDISQTRSIGESIHYATRYMDGKRTLREIIERISRDISQEGLNVLAAQPVGDLAAFRGLELAAAINRLRTLSVRQARD